MSGTPAVVWFRQDLRLADNPALQAAIESGSPVLPVFIWAPEEQAPWAPGSASRCWLHQSLEKLRDSLRKLGSDIIIRRGPSMDALVVLAAESGATAIYWNRLYEPAAIARDRELKKAPRERGLVAESFPGNLLLNPGRFELAPARLPRVYRLLEGLLQGARSALRINGLDRRRLSLEGELPENAMTELSRWVKKTAGDALPVLVAYPLSLKHASPAVGADSGVVP